MRSCRARKRARCRGSSVTSIRPSTDTRGPVSGSASPPVPSNSNPARGSALMLAVWSARSISSRGDASTRAVSTSEDKASRPHRAGRSPGGAVGRRMTRRAMVAGGMASGLMVGFIWSDRRFPGAALRISARFRAAMVPYWQTRVQVRKRDFPHSDGCFDSRIRTGASLQACMKERRVAANDRAG